MYQYVWYFWFIGGGIDEYFVWGDLCLEVFGGLSGSQLFFYFFFVVDVFEIEVYVVEYKWIDVFMGLLVQIQEGQGSGLCLCLFFVCWVCFKGKGQCFIVEEGNGQWFGGLLVVFLMFK